MVARDISKWKEISNVSFDPLQLQSTLKTQRELFHMRLIFWLALFILFALGLLMAGRIFWIRRVLPLLPFMLGMVFWSMIGAFLGNSLSLIFIPAPGWFSWGLSVSFGLFVGTILLSEDSDLKKL